MSTYPIEPKVIRLVPFHSEGGALAAVDIAFGPISVNTKLYKTASGYFLSLPSRKSEAQDKWYEQVSVNDPFLLKMAETRAVSEFERLSRSEVVAV
jgi:hypothetical protein